MNPRTLLAGIALHLLLLVSTTRAGSGDSCVSVDIQPVECLHTINDVVTITIANECADTLYCTPELASHIHGTWRTIAGDLELTWKKGPFLPDEPHCCRGYLLPPHSKRSIDLSLRDVAALFRNHILLRVQLVSQRMTAGAPGPEAMVYSKPFMLEPTTDEEERPLNVIRRTMWKRDTIYTVYDPATNTPLIPDSIFQHPSALLQIVDPFDSVKTERKDRTRYMLIWEAPSIEGRLELVITKLQVWLRSGHDIATPNELFWITSITPRQYAALTGAIERHRAEFMEMPLATGFIERLYWKGATPEKNLYQGSNDIDVRKKDYLETRYTNAKRLIDLLNSGLPADRRVAFPKQDALDGMSPVRWEMTLERWHSTWEEPETEEENR